MLLPEDTTQERERATRDGREERFCVGGEEMKRRQGSTPMTGKTMEELERKIENKLALLE